MDNPLVILVDQADKPLGVMDKLQAHQKGLCHRAFSVFIVRLYQEQWQVLLQKRQADKYHCGGLWTNTCCSHPYPDEDIIAAGQRRLVEEMGIQVSLQEVGYFHYIAHFDNGLTENELDHVLIGHYNDKPFHINPLEVEATRWENLQDLPKLIAQDPQHYTPWLLQALSFVEKHIKEY